MSTSQLNPDISPIETLSPADGRLGQVDLSRALGVYKDAVAIMILISKDTALEKCGKD